MTAGAEAARLAEAGWPSPAGWRLWGPFVSERAWGSVREDYSWNGDAWRSFPHDHARSRTYRWNEDGLAGICDRDQRLCFALALWNGRDPILKERLFGLTGPEGNHGEDVKEVWWYLDATPTHSWLRWRYHYPQAAFPYDDLVQVNAERSRRQPEYELLDTGVFDEDRYWCVTVDYAKAAPDDICVRVTALNEGPDTAELHLLPTVWFRNRWAWGGDAPRPRLWAEAGAVHAEHTTLGRYVLVPGAGPDGAPPNVLFCENETNAARIYGLDGGPRYPKDGIHDHVVHSAATVNPAGEGTKAACWYRLEVEPRREATVLLRLSPTGSGVDGAGEILDARQREADELYAGLVPETASADEAAIVRQGMAGMLWGLKHYHFDVTRWLDGDAGLPPPPAERRFIRNGTWRHVDVRNVISMPDPWEYPWFATWDLAFHTIVLAHVDPALAKQQLLLMTREWLMHPNGQLPAYEWEFGDVNPPVHAFAALQVFDIDGRRDFEFLEHIFQRLIANFTWWLNRKDPDGNGLFEGGFLGLDNIGPFDRSKGLGGGAVLEQSDATGWMAMFALDMVRIGLLLAPQRSVYEDMTCMFLRYFLLVANAVNEQGLWDEASGLFCDVIRYPDGRRVPVPIHSLVAVLPLLASLDLSVVEAEHLPRLRQHVLDLRDRYPELFTRVGQLAGSADRGTWLLSVATPERLRRLLGLLFDEAEFLSAGGVRSLSRFHDAHPFSFASGSQIMEVRYEPGESQTPLFGGNSNWRGPVWFPINYLLVRRLRSYDRYFGDGLTVDVPAGSGQRLTLGKAADELTSRLIGLFRRGDDGRRPIWGDSERFQTDPRWGDQLWFHEYFHAETGAGLGACHQTGWTGLVADLVLRR